MFFVAVFLLFRRLLPQLAKSKDCLLTSAPTEGRQDLQQTECMTSGSVTEATDSKLMSLEGDQGKTSTETSEASSEGEKQQPAVASSCTTNGASGQGDESLCSDSSGVKAKLPEPLTESEHTSGEEQPKAD